MGKNYSRIGIATNTTILIATENALMTEPNQNSEQNDLQKQNQKYYWWDMIKIALTSINLYSKDDDKDHEETDPMKLTIYNCTIKMEHENNKADHKKFDKLYTLKPYWDILISFVLCYHLLLLPFIYAFNILDDTWYLVVETIIDLLLLIDLIYDVRFDLKKLDTKEKVMKASWNELLPFNKQILLIIQLIPCIPFQIFSFDLVFIKILRMSYLHRITSILQQLLENLFITSARYMNEILSIISFFKTLIIFIFIAHFTATLWIKIAKSEDNESWISLYEASHLQSTGNNLTSVDVYIDALYFIIETFSTVGYGDQQTIPSFDEKFYQMFAMVLGGILYAFLNASIKYILVHFGLAYHISYKYTDDIRLWLFRINRKSDFLFPKKLWNRTRDILFQNVQIRSDDVFRDNEFFKKLAPEIQIEIMKRAYSKFLDIYGDYLNGTSELFVFEFLLKLDPKNCQSNQILLKNGRSPDNVYFVMDKTIFIHDNSQKDPLGYLEIGDIIGDDLVLFEKESKYTYRVNDYRSIFCLALEKQELIELKSKFPSDIDKIKVNIMRRLSIKGEYRKINRVIFKHYPIYADWEMGKGKDFVATTRNNLIQMGQIDEFSHLLIEENNQNTPLENARLNFDLNESNSNLHSDNDFDANNTKQQKTTKLGTSNLYGNSHLETNVLNIGFDKYDKNNIYDIENLETDANERGDKFHKKDIPTNDSGEILIQDKKRLEPEFSYENLLINESNILQFHPEKSLSSQLESEQNSLSSADDPFNLKLEHLKINIFLNEVMQ